VRDPQATQYPRLLTNTTSQWSSATSLCTVVQSVVPMRKEAGRLRVLVVEDEVILAMEIEDLVQREGHDVVGVAVDATRALALARTHQPDLALVDLYLQDGLTGPEIGWTLLHECNVPVIFATASPELVPEDLDDALGVLSKPFTASIFSGVMTYAVARLNDEHAILDLPRGLKRVRQRG
jgi:two-component system, response regulator PdtaR